MLLRSALRMVHILHLVDVHARGAHRTCLLVECGDQTGVLLSHGGCNLREIALSCSVCCRVDLKRIGAVGLLLEVKLGGHILHRVDRIVDLQVLKCHLFIVLLLLVLGLRRLLVLIVVFGRLDVDV